MVWAFDFVVLSLNHQSVDVRETSLAKVERFLVPRCLQRAALQDSALVHFVLL